MIVLNNEHMSEFPKIFKNKYGLFRIEIDGHNIKLQKWQNTGWEYVYSIEDKKLGWLNSIYRNGHVESMMEMSEILFGPYDKLVKNVDGNLVSLA